MKKLYNLILFIFLSTQWLVASVPSDSSSVNKNLLNPEQWEQIVDYTNTEVTRFYIECLIKNGDLEESDVKEFDNKLKVSIYNNEITDPIKFEKLNSTVRIISGLYGLLKPTDLIQPYRLEMGTKFPVGKNKNLYEFWKKSLTKALNDELEEGELFLNLASNEYFKAIDTKLLKVPVVNCSFKDFKNGEYKIISFFAKEARGLMTRYIIDTNAKTIDDLKGFNYESYSFSESMSTETELVFIR